MATPSILVDPTLLFEFTIAIARFEPKNRKSKTRKTTSKSGLSNERWLLSENHVLPHFASLTSHLCHSTVYAAWSEAGLYFMVRVQGKSSLPRFIQPRGGFSDGLRIWIDTRNSPGIHRATRFCHCFHFFPGLPKSSSAAKINDLPLGILDEIPRAREHPAAISNGDLEVQSEFTADGYSLWAHIPSQCLTGFSPLEFDRISLFYDVVDQELGTQSMTLGPELRYAEDPSLWVQANLRESFVTAKF